MATTYDLRLLRLFRGGTQFHSIRLTLCAGLRFDQVVQEFRASYRDLASCTVIAVYDLTNQSFIS